MAGREYQAPKRPSGLPYGRPPQLVLALSFHAPLDTSWAVRHSFILALCRSCGLWRQPQAVLVLPWLASSLLKQAETGF